MCINQFLLCKNLISYKDIMSAKNYAFSINMVFSHERMCHGKESLSNPGIPSPTIFFNINFKKEIFQDSYYDNNQGEAGRIFESFIADTILIKVLKDNLCFGKFFDYKYFSGDFKEINEEAFKVLSSTQFYRIYKLIKVIICLLGIYFHFYIFYSLNQVFEINMIFYVIIYMLTLIIIIIISYKFYNNKKIINMNIFNYDLFGMKYREKKKLIFPDDYPLKSNSLFGRIFDFFNLRKKNIRRILRKYTLKKYVRYDENMNY